MIENICLLGIDSPSLSFFTIGVILYFVYGLGESRHFLINDTNINEFGRYEELRQTIDKNRAKEYFERIEGRKIIPPKVNIKVDKLLREFIVRGGFEIQMPEEYKLVR